MCFAAEYDKQNNIVADCTTDNDPDNCSDQRDYEKIFDLQKTHGVCAIICMVIGDDNLSTVVDFFMYTANVQTV